MKVLVLCVCLLLWFGVSNSIPNYKLWGDPDREVRGVPDFLILQKDAGRSCEGSCTETKEFKDAQWIDCPFPRARLEDNFGFVKAGTKFSNTQYGYTRLALQPNHCFCGRKTPSHAHFYKEFAVEIKEALSLYTTYASYLFSPRNKEYLPKKLENLDQSVKALKEEKNQFENLLKNTDEKKKVNQLKMDLDKALPRTIAFMKLYGEESEVVKNSKAPINWQEGELLSYRRALLRFQSFLETYNDLKKTGDELSGKKYECNTLTPAKVPKAIAEPVDTNKKVAQVTPPAPGSSPPPIQSSTLAEVPRSMKASVTVDFSGPCTALDASCELRAEDSCAAPLPRNASGFCQDHVDGLVSSETQVSVTKQAAHPSMDHSQSNALSKRRTWVMYRVFHSLRKLYTM